jgi:two-component system cell cycle sensor histidine kinase PleC
MFAYLRIFLIASLLVIVSLVVAGGFAFHHVATSSLSQIIERDSATVVQGYNNIVWQKHRVNMLPLTAGDPQALRGNPLVAEFAQDTVRYFQNMPLARVNIYSSSGVLLMTANINSAEKWASANPSPDANFVLEAIRGGRIVSRVSTASLQGLTDATIMQTLVPLQSPSGQGVELALEVLSNVTGPWDDLQKFQIYGTIAISLTFIVFLSILLYAAAKSENIISKQHEMNAELIAVAANAKAENQEKSQFLANVSHELRTPLNAIIGFSDIIKNEVVLDMEGGKYGEYINDINSAGVHLLSLINDILDYSKAEAGKLELEVSEINANKLIQNCIRLVTARAESGQVNLIDASPKEPVILITDGKKFKQVMLNLLSNAVKFTPPGGDVRVSVWHDLNDDGYTFEVRDTGIGISPKDIAQAMAPFGQVDNALSRKYEGTGLGLPLTKKFIELMGGKFNIASKVDSGTTIAFTLPREIQPREGIIIKQVG